MRDLHPNGTWVFLPGRFSAGRSQASLITSHRVSTVTVGGRPLRALSESAIVAPNRLNRPRHFRTVCKLQPTARAIAGLPSPRPAARTMRARCTPENRLVVLRAAV